MNKYIQDWLDVIENMNNDNTYKLAWGRAILEIIYPLNNLNDVNVIHFENIAHKMIKYYWNQSFFFNLRQSANIKKPPVLVQQVDILIERYKELTGSNIPVWFDKAETELNKDKEFYEKIIYKCFIIKNLLYLSQFLSVRSGQNQQTSNKLVTNFRPFLSVFSVAKIYDCLYSYFIYLGP